MAWRNRLDQVDEWHIFLYSNATQRQMLVDVEIYSANQIAVFCNQLSKLMANFLFKMSAYCLNVWQPAVSNQAVVHRVHPSMCMRWSERQTFWTKICQWIFVKQCFAHFGACHLKKCSGKFYHLCCTIVWYTRLQNYVNFYWFIQKFFDSDLGVWYLGNAVCLILYYTRSDSQL